MKKEKQNSYKKVIYILLLLFIIGDLFYSFGQFQQMKTDGDMRESIILSEQSKKLFSSPFGTKVIRDGEGYPNPNRFFGHWTFRQVFTKGVLGVQSFASPIDSIFLTIGAAKTSFHLALLLLLSIAITGSKQVLSFNNVLAMAILVPLFQVNGAFKDSIGIVAHAITYDFSYALPSVYLIWVLLPLSFWYLHKKDYFTKWYSFLFYIPVLIISNFSGALNQAVYLIVALIFYMHLFTTQFSDLRPKPVAQRFFRSIVPKNQVFWLLIVPLSLVALYSFYIGTFNTNQDLYPHSTLDLYLKIPKGIQLQFFNRADYTLVLLVLGVNYFLIRKIKDEKGKRILRMYRFLLLFIIIYIALLPLGGYKAYRPYILRNDSVVPVIIGIVFLFGLTSVHVVHHLRRASLKYYLPVLITVLLIFQATDKYGKQWNRTEKESLQMIADSEDEIVKLPRETTILSWYMFDEPRQSSNAADMLRLWNVTDRRKLFYQPEDSVAQP